jgi:hypothetical protein
LRCENGNQRYPNNESHKLDQSIYTTMGISFLATSPVRMATLSPLFESSSLLPLGLPHSLHAISKAVYERLFCGPCLTPLLVRIGLHPIEFFGPIFTKDKRRLSFSKKPPPP